VEGGFGTRPSAGHGVIIRGFFLLVANDAVWERVGQIVEIALHA
jgi:hypothetical protein